jgi:hypothetical protein
MEPLSFSDFLDKMKDPAAADLVRSIKGFIKQFEDRSPAAAASIDPEMDSVKVQAFLIQSEQAFRAHPVWKGSSPDVHNQAVEGLEKYIMSKIWRHTFAVSREDIDRDERYARLSEALSFVDLDTLAGCAFPADGTLLSLAQGELLKMDRYKAPRDKLVCLANVRSMVEGAIQAAANSGATITGGADAFFPAFLYVVLKAKLPKLASNVEYCKRFRMESRLSGQFDYMLANLESAALYLDTVNWEHLKISREEFVSKLSAAGIPEAQAELVGNTSKKVDLSGVGEELPLISLDTLDDNTNSNSSGNGVVEEPVKEEEEQQQQQGEVEGVAVVQSPLPPIDLLQLDDTTTNEGGGGHPLDKEEASPSSPPVSSAPSAFQQLGEGSMDVLDALTPGAERNNGQLDTLSPTPTLTPLPADEASSPLQQQPVKVHVPEQPSSPIRGGGGGGGGGIIEDLIVQGTRAVLEAESTGDLHQRYPYMYASPDTLNLDDISTLLGSYREAVFKYEALSAALRQQFGSTTTTSETALGNKNTTNNNNATKTNACTAAQQQAQRVSSSSTAAGMAEAALASLGGAANILLKRWGTTSGNGLEGGGGPSMNATVPTTSTAITKTKITTKPASGGKDSSRVFHALFGSPSPSTANGIGVEQEKEEGKKEGGGGDFD